MQTKWQVEREEELEDVAVDLLHLLDEGKVCTLQGDLGVGKTTLVQRFCKKLGVTEAVTSPTYALVNLYSGAKGMIQHLDLYRLKSIEEALDMGIEEYLSPDYLTFIEWPEIIGPLLPLDCVRLQLEGEAGEARKIVLLGEQ